MIKMEPIFKLGFYCYLSRALNWLICKDSPGVALSDRTGPIIGGSQSDFRSRDKAERVPACLLFCLLSALHPGYLTYHDSSIVGSVWLM